MGYLAKGFLQKLPAMLLFHWFWGVVHRGSMRVRQGYGWFKTLAAVTMGQKTSENPKLQNWNEESAVQRGVCSALHFRVRRKLAVKFPTFSDIFRTPCSTVFDVQHVRTRFPTISAFYRKISANFRTAEAPLRGWEGLGFEACVVQQGSVSGVTLEHKCPKSRHR